MLKQTVEKWSDKMLNFQLYFFNNIFYWVYAQVLTKQTYGYVIISLTWVSISVNFYFLL